MKKSSEQRRRALDHKNKRYKEDPEYRKKINETSKNWFSKQTKEKQIEIRKKQQAASRAYTRKLQSKLEITGNPKFFFLAKLRKVKRSIKDKQRNLQVTITIDQLLDLYKKQNGLCHYTGERLVLKAFTGKIISRKNINELKNYCTLDRLDNNKGYEQGNIVLSTYKVNIARGSLNYEEFLKICQNIKDKGLY